MRFALRRDMFSTAVRDKNQVAVRSMCQESKSGCAPSVVARAPRPCHTCFALFLYEVHVTERSVLGTAQDESGSRDEAIPRHLAALALLLLFACVIFVFETSL